MIGVKFNNYHSYNDLHLILNSYTVGFPEVKTAKVDIPGADGYLETTAYFGEPKYYTRLLTFNFSTIIPQTGFLDLYSTINDALHGKRADIVLDGDPDYQYTGTVKISDFTKEKNIGKITITCECDPYKLMLRDTVATIPVTGTAKRVLKNQRKTVSPTIETDGPVIITCAGKEYRIPAAGRYNIPALVLREGNNELQFAGDCVVRVIYREGRL